MFCSMQPGGFFIGEERVSFTGTASFAYDAVWSLALGLKAVIEDLASDCGSGTSLEGFHPLDRHMGRRNCVGDLLRDTINAVTFEGVSVSVICTYHSCNPVHCTFRAM